MHPSLAAWHTNLEREDDWYHSPRLKHGDLMESAKALLDQGAVDFVRWHELYELALAAREHYLEAMANDYLRPSRQFEIHDCSGALAGEADGHQIELGSRYRRFLAQRGPLGHWVIDTTMGWTVARVVGRDLIFVAGDRYQLTHIATRVNGEIVPVESQQQK